MKNFNTTYPGHQSSQSMAADVKLEDCGQITSNSSGENKSTLEHSQNQPVPLFLDPLSLQSRLSFLPGLDSNGGVSPTRTQLTHCELLLKSVRESFSRGKAQKFNGLA